MNRLPKKQLSSKTVFSIASLLFVLNIIGTYMFCDILSTNIDKEASLFNETKQINTDLNQSTKMLIPLGDNFGIKLYTDGVIVSGLQDINSNGKIFSPAKDAGIKEGDYILEINGVKVQDNSHFTHLIANLNGSTATLTIKRDERVFETQITPFLDDLGYKVGMWIRDSAAGIGTLTFYDPENGNFAGLGHGICDVDTGELLSLKDGEPSPIKITGIIKGMANDPGKINGYFDTSESLGTIYANTETGIYGHLNFTPEQVLMSVGKKEELHTGTAHILSNIENCHSKLFEVSIESIDGNFNKDTKNFVIKITDPDLLTLTGGIIQGMSGSPIIQDNKLVGAVTHVFIDDPTKGYGIFIENMLDTAENVD